MGTRPVRHLGQDIVVFLRKPELQLARFAFAGGDPIRQEEGVLLMSLGSISKGDTMNAGNIFVVEEHFKAALPSFFPPGHFGPLEAASPRVSAAQTSGSAVPLTFPRRTRRAKKGTLLDESICYWLEIYPFCSAYEREGGPVESGPISRWYTLGFVSKEWVAVKLKRTVMSANLTYTSRG